MGTIKKSGFNATYRGLCAVLAKHCSIYVSLIKWRRAVRTYPSCSYKYSVTACAQIYKWLFTVIKNQLASLILCSSVIFFQWRRLNCENGSRRSCNVILQHDLPELFWNKLRLKTSQHTENMKSLLAYACLNLPVFLAGFGMTTPRTTPGKVSPKLIIMIKRGL